MSNPAEGGPSAAEGHILTRHTEGLDETVSEMIGSPTFYAIMKHIRAYSNQTALNMGLSCRVFNQNMINKDDIWIEALAQDFATNESLPGVSPYEHYKYLCAYTWLEGLYIYDQFGHFQKENYKTMVQHSSEIVLIDIDVTTERIKLSYLKEDEYLPRLIKLKPFLEAELVSDGCTPAQLKGLSAVQVDPIASEQSMRWTIEDFIAERCPLEEWLSPCTTLFKDLSEIIMRKYLVKIQFNASRILHPNFRPPGMTWPHSMPRPGMYGRTIGMHEVILRYDGQFMTIQPVNTKPIFDFIGHCVFNLASATSVDDGAEIDELDFLALEEATDGKPLRMSELQEVTITKKEKNGSFRIVYRAWYTGTCSSRNNCKVKLFAQTEHIFILVSSTGRWAMTWRQISSRI